MSSSPPPKKELAPSYRHVAWVYDLLASAYSLGAIDRAKTTHHDLINSGDRVLYAGAGRGKEIAEACDRGAEVTCVEPCPAMASKLHTRLSGVADGFAVVPKPIQSIPAERMYDLVIAHFFLNLFNDKTMPEVLDHLCGFVKPGGRIIISDFKPNKQSDSRIAKLLRTGYYRPLNHAGRLLNICALHPIYDYAPMLIERGFEIGQRDTFHVLPGLPPLYETIVAQLKK